METEQQEQKLLTKLAQAGDQEAFAALYNQHRTSALYLALGVLGDYDDAADVLQEACWRAWQKLIAPNCLEIDFGPWLRKITYNRAVTWMARRALFNKKVRELGLVEWMSLKSRSVESMVVERESVQEIRHALEQLPAKGRIALSLQILKESSIEDIALALHCSPEHAKYVLKTSKIKLRSDLQGDGLPLPPTTSLLEAARQRVASLPPDRHISYYFHSHSQFWQANFRDEQGKWRSKYIGPFLPEMLPDYPCVHKQTQNRKVRQYP